NAYFLSLLHELADHPRASESFSGARRTLNRENGTFHCARNSACRGFRQLARKRTNYFFAQQTRSSFQQQIARSTICAWRVHRVCRHPLGDAKNAFGLFFHIKRSIPEIEPRRIQLRRFLGFLDVDSSICKIDGDDRAEFFHFAVRLFSFTSFRLLPLETIPVSRNFLVHLHALEEMK